MNRNAVRILWPSKKMISPQSTGTRRKLAQVRMQMACAEDLFNFTTDEDMMDSCIYQLKSLQLYYSFLMRQVRQEELGPPARTVEAPPPLLETQAEGMVESVG